MKRFARNTMSAGCSPRFGVQDLAEFHARLSQLRGESFPPPPTDVGGYVAYTDGACLGNPNGPGGWGTVIATQENDSSSLWELWGHLSSTSNNRAEALAFLAALEWVPAGSRLLVRSDSEYVVRIVEGTYKAKANADIWQQIAETRRAKQHALQIEWLRGHAGDSGNERADRLAFLGASGRESADTEGRTPARVVPKARAKPTLPPDLEGIVPKGPWESSFISSVARQLRAGKTLSEKQQAIVDRIRARGRASATDPA